jgi:hypothetical protein
MSSCRSGCSWALPIGYATAPVISKAPAGPKESAIHLLMLGEAGAALLLGIFFDIDGLVILLMTACFVAHDSPATGILLMRRRAGASHRSRSIFMIISPSFLSWR